MPMTGCSSASTFSFFTPVVVVAVVALVLSGGSFVTKVQAQQQCGTSRRRPWRDLSCQEQFEYMEAVQALKDDGIYDDFTRVHWDSAEWAHNVPEFLPWHRWYLWVFEKELQRVSGTCMTVPYWDWERGDTLPIMLKSWTFGTRNRGCVRDGIARDWEPAGNGERCLQRDFDTDWEFSRDVEVLSRITNLRDFDDFAEALEGSPHAAPHEFIGGPMQDNWSPDDPLFWLHHSNVDRIWTLWQDYRDHDEVDPEDFEWTHFSSDLDEPLRFDEGPFVDFSLPGRSRPPTPREMLTNVDGVVDAQYVNDAMARLLLETSRSYRNGGNNPDWISASTARITERCVGGEDDDEGVCTENGDSCDSRSDCCSNFCSPTAGVCARVCTGIGEKCETHDDCCSNACNRFGRCEDASGSRCLALGSSCDSNDDCCSAVCGITNRCVEPEPTCSALGVSCESGGECCSNYCSSRRCWQMCYARGSLCDTDEECCSGICNESGRCEGDIRRSLAETDVNIKDEPLDFSDDKVKARWYDLITEFPDDPAQIWEILARADCEDRAALVGHEIRSASSKWIETMFKGGNTRVFNCHFTG